MGHKSGRNVKSVVVVKEALQKLNHATAQEILDWISVATPHQEVSLTSIYRALNQLVSDTHVKPLNFNDGQVRYELNTPHGHHHHFVCTQCNRIEVVDICPFEAVSSTLNNVFKVHYHNFEVFGLCGPCQN